MSILAKLAERKDIAKYITARTCELEFQISKEQLLKFPEKDRQNIRKKIQGRLLELREFHRIINQHEEKKMATKYWENRREWRESRDEYRREHGQLPPLKD
jgi:hypothetical protein